ncbi:MAG: NUDIX hydrolase [Gammaproteobacteria bacterium]|jgi:phosphohistidine phosphatase
MADVPAYFYNQSAVFPCRLRNGRIEILLISSRRKKHWIIPKGVVEPGLDARHSAAKEALEEAGVEGTVEKDSLGTYTYRKWGGTCTVRVFVMQVTLVHDHWEESYRERLWLPIDDAKKKLNNSQLDNLIDSLNEDFPGERFAP